MAWLANKELAEDALYTLLMLAELAAFLVPLCAKLPRRDHPWLRAAACTAAVVALELVRGPLRAGEYASGGFSAALLANFTFTLAEVTLATMCVLRISGWQALFCCTAAYTAQNCVSGLEWTFGKMNDYLYFMVPPLAGPLAIILPLAVIYPIYLVLFASSVRENDLASVVEPQISLSALIVVVIVIGFDIALKSVPFGLGQTAALVMMRFAHMTVCAYVLYSEYKVLEAKKLGAEAAVEKRLSAERERQYAVSRANIDAINMKCHDIRHQIRSLATGGAQVSERALHDLAHEVDVYDSTVETGNAVLDTILTEKGLVCSQEGVTLSVIADGEALNFVDSADVYALFGNALDNAIEAVRRLSARSKRRITLDVRQRRGFTVVRVENPCPAEPRFVDGLPRSTKGDLLNHGFGMRSMRAIAERYEGALTCGWESGTFWLNVLLVRPE